MSLYFWEVVVIVVGGNKMKKEKENIKSLTMENIKTWFFMLLMLFNVFLAHLLKNIMLKLAIIVCLFYIIEC